MAGGRIILTEHDAAGLAPAARAFRERVVSQARSAAAGAERTQLVIAGERVVLDIADPALGAGLLPALAHHAVPQADPDGPVDGPDAIQIVVWSDPLGAFPWSHAHLGRGGAIAGLSHGPVRAVADGTDSILVLWDAERRLACCWFAGAGALRPWDFGAPLRTALNFALGGPSRQLVHAATVGVAGRGVLIAGPGGSGKSTTTLACLEAGLQVVGDDYAVVELTDQGPRAWNLFRSIKVGRRAGSVDERRTLLMGVDLGGAPHDQLEIAAVLVPEITDAPASSLHPATAAHALRALAPSTLMQAPREGRPTLGPMAALVRDVPAQRLLLGADRGVPAIRSVLGA